LAQGRIALFHPLARLGRGSGFGYSYRLNWHAEHYPVAACRLLLGDENDRDGLPTIALDWHTGDAETSGVRRALSLFDEALRKSGTGRFDHDPGALAALMNVGDQPSGSIVGGARMGSNPRYSVTDADGRVHDVDNLYVTGTAVFPTSGLDSPLLTVAALSFRLADHLKQREQARPARLCSLPQPGEASAEERAARA
jgi:choline dehydrogenase-like flavoprotein